MPYLISMTFTGSVGTNASISRDVNVSIAGGFAILTGIGREDDNSERT